MPITVKLSNFYEWVFFQHNEKYEFVNMLIKVQIKYYLNNDGKLFIDKNKL